MRGSGSRSPRARELGERLHLAAAHPYLETGMMLERFAETERVAREGIEQLREMGESGYLATSLIYLADAITSRAGQTKQRRC